MFLLTISFTSNLTTFAQVGTSTAPPLYEGKLYIDDQGTPSQRGGSLAVLADSNLYLVIYFGGLPQQMGQIDLYDGDPRSGGTVSHNLGIGIPGATGFGGGLKSTLTLTPAEVNSLDAGQLYIQILTSSGNTEDAAVGNILPTAMAEPTLVESVLYRQTHERPVEHGSILAVQDGLDVHLTMFFMNMTSPWTTIDLLKGSLTDEGEVIHNLGLNFSVAPESSFGLGTTVTLTESEIEDLNNGLLFVRVLGQQPSSEIRGQILLHPNRAPGQSGMISPSLGETYVIGGDTNEDPVGAEEILLTVEVSDTTDPDGNPIQYFWQISRVETFSLGVTYTTSLGIDVVSRDFTVGEMADIFDATWAGSEPPAFTPVTYYVRSLTSDGAAFTFGETESATLVRGKVTANDPGAELPTTLTLHGNYPNPFNPSTKILFDLPATANVKVRVVNIIGQTVAQYSPGVLAPGERLHIDVDASALPSGLYFYQISADTGQRTLTGQGQMVLLK